MVNDVIAAASAAGEPKREINEAAARPELEPERAEGSQMVSEDGLRHDMHPPTEIRAVPDRESYKARLGADFDAAREQEFDREVFFEGLETEQDAENEPYHAQENQHEAELGDFDKDEFLSELEAEEDAPANALEQQEADQDHWDDFDYSTYSSAADEAEAKAAADDERPQPDHFDPLPGDRSLSEEFNQVDDDFNWRSYESAADAFEKNEAAARAKDNQDATFDKDKFLNEWEKSEEFDSDHESRSGYDHDYDM